MATVVNTRFNRKLGLATSFNGMILEEVLTDMDVKVKTLSIEKEGLLKQEHHVTKVSGRHGAYFYGKTYGERTIQVKLLMQGKNKKAVQRKLEVLNHLLHTDSPAPLAFSDEADRFFWAQYESVDSDDRIGTSYQLILTFICYDPFKYSDVKTVTGDAVTYNGDYHAKPKITLTLTASGSELRLLHVEKQEYIRLTGRYESGNQIEIDMKKRTIKQNGRSILSDLDVLGSRFFSLSKGRNTLSVNLKHSTVVEFREVFA